MENFLRVLLVVIFERTRKVLRLYVLFMFFASFIFSG